MKVLLNLTNDTLEYRDTKVFIQGTDARNKIIVYADEDITFTNLTIAYQLQNGRTTIAMSNSGVVESSSDDYIEGYTGYIFNVPLSVTVLTGNIMATVVANISGAKHKFNILNTVIDSVFFEAYETALEEAESEFASDIQAMQSAITQLQSGKADKTALNAEIARATAKEGELETAIGNETTARIADVDAEELRATAKENEIAGDLATEILRATGVESGLNTRLSTLENRCGYIEMEQVRNLTSAELQEALKPNCIIKVNDVAEIQPLGSAYFYKVRSALENTIKFDILHIPERNVSDVRISIYRGYITFNATDGTIKTNASQASSMFYNSDYIDYDLFLTSAELQEIITEISEVFE